MNQAVDTAEQGGLSRAIRTDDRDDLPLVELYGYISQDLRLAVAGGEVQLRVEERLGHAGAGPRLLDEEGQHLDALSSDDDIDERRARQQPLPFVCASAFLGVSNAAVD